MRDLNRLIGPVPLTDAHMLSPFPSVENVVDHMGRGGTDVDAPIWFFERVPVEKVDPVGLVHVPDQIQKTRMKRLQKALVIGSTACAVLEHVPSLPTGRGEFSVVDGDLALTAAYTGSIKQVLVWVAHQHRCCAAGAPRSTAPRWG